MVVLNHSYNLVKNSNKLSATAIALVLGTVAPGAFAKEEGHEVQKGGTIDFSSCVRPEWPKDALATNRVGTVTMALLVAADGTIKNSRITHSSGHTDLDDAARVGLSKCRFIPGKIDSKPVETWTLVRYVWALD